MSTYYIKGVFTTDRSLTQDELNTLANMLTLQIEEPTDFDGQECEYSTQTPRQITIEKEGEWNVWQK